MSSLVKHCLSTPRTLTFYSRLVDHCLSSNSLHLTKPVHAQLIKVGFNNHTFLGNRTLDLYILFRCTNDVLKAFSDITRKNDISWNICFKGMLNCGHTEMAFSVFHNMPSRDVVSWNSMISWHASCGHSHVVWQMFREMLHDGVKPSAYTYSILASVVADAIHGKELHGSMIRSGLIGSNVVLENSVVDMYGNLGMLDYAFGVFLTMEQPDVISWNSLIMGCCRNGHEELALTQFSLMRSLGFSPDEFTCSSVVTCCTNLQSLQKGEQIMAFCSKVAFLCNSTVLSAIIDLFSKCNRLENSVKLFKEVDTWNSAICNAIISSYSWHGIGENALNIFVLMLRENIRPTEFTLSSILTSLYSIPVEQGTQMHSWVVKSGFEMENIVASSLLHMYAKFGSIDSAIKVFASMVVRDLISWNTMIMGLTLNGRFSEAIHTFKDLQRRGLQPDRISLTEVLLACNYGGYIDEGITAFLETKESYGLTPCYEHYTILVELLCRSGRFKEVIEITEKMPYEPDSRIWGSLLHACVVHGDVKLAEIVVERLIELEPHLSLPYLLLARIYEMRGQWEDVVRVKETLRIYTAKKVKTGSWIGIKNSIYAFTADDPQHHVDNETYSILQLVTREWEKDETTYMELEVT